MFNFQSQIALNQFDEDLYHSFTIENNFMIELYNSQMVLTVVE